MKAMSVFMAGALCFFVFIGFATGSDLGPWWFWALIAAFLGLFWLAASFLQKLNK